MPRGSRPGKKAKLTRWGNKKASHGRKPGLGKRPKFATWKDVRKQIKRNETVVIPPTKDEAPAPAPAAAAPAPAPAETADS